MKTIFLTLAVAVLSFVSIDAQGSDSGNKFFFDTYKESININNVQDEDSHMLGDVIAKKMKVINNTFLVRFETKVGLSSSDVEVQKPDILESVEKLDKFYKKAVKKNLIDKQTATQQLSNYLDIAYTLFYEDSANFEKKLGQADKAEEIMALYDSVEFMNDKMTANN